MRALHLLPLIGVVACAGAALESADRAGGDTGFNEAPPGDGDYGADTGDVGDTDTAPPEEEDDYLRLAPAATNVYVFVANPTRDTVTRIEVGNLAVKTVTVGDTPTAVETSADYTLAVTLDEGSDTVSVIDADTLAVTQVEIRENFNALDLSDDGKWAAAWYDPDRESEGHSGGVQTFNEVSFVNLTTLEHTPMAVGFNPRGVRWSVDGTLALVVSDATLAVIDLTASTLVPTLIDIAADPTDPPEAEEVELAPDGGYAFVRQFGTDTILVVDLATFAVEPVPVGANPTDLDISPDGRQVAVVSRGAQELWLLDATNPFGGADRVEMPNAYGSVLYAGAGEKAVLYTNATLLDTFGVWDTVEGTVEERGLVKPVQSMGIDPTGGSMLVFHTREDAADADTTSPFYGEWALTLVDLSDFRQNPLLLPAEPTSYAVTDDGNYGFFIMEEQKWLETLVFGTLLYEEVPLPSVPVHLGVLPGTDMAYASQEHDLGRISFYDASTDEIDTLTGFELNSEIEH